MPRKIVPIDPTSRYFITARCINREWFRIPVPEVWDIMSNYLYFLHHAYDFKIYSFILMSNHFHMIIECPSNNMCEGMNYFMRETSRVISRTSGRINQVYGGPYNKSRLSSELAFLHAYKYTYRNPIEAGLSKVAESYKFSTLHGLIGQSRLLIPVCEDLVLFSNVEAQIRWINEKYKGDDKKYIRNALRRSEFQIANKKSSNKEHRLKKKLS